MRKEGAALLHKWEKTGLLEGLNTDASKNGMARLLENQAKQLLKEAASTMSGGDVEGFAAVAFPIVRRVFGGLIANELVSVQPMSSHSVELTSAVTGLGLLLAIRYMVAARLVQRSLVVLILVVVRVPLLVSFIT